MNKVVDLQRYQTWLARGHAAASFGYDQAIDNYKKQKDIFLEQLSQSGTKATEDILKQINDSVFNTVSEEIASDIETILNDVARDFENIYSQILENNSADLTSLKNKIDSNIDKRIQKHQKIDLKSVYKSMIKYIEDILKNQKIDRNFVLKYSINGQTSQDIQNQLFGYIRKLLFNKVYNISEYNSINFINALKGYYKEKLLKKVFNNFLTNFGYRAEVSASSTNDSGQQIIIDLILGKQQIIQGNTDQFQDLIQNLSNFNSFTANGEINILDSDLTYSSIGIQSKSWVTPWSNFRKGQATFNTTMSFGGHSNLLPALEVDRHYWHAGLHAAMSNVMNVIGVRNGIFSTGNEIYWTAELLTELKNRQYVLAFVKENGMLTSEVKAMSHSL